MTPSDEGSVTRWIGDLKAGEAEAAQPLWERYFARLVRLARGKLQGDRRRAGAADEEDVALSAFHSVCLGAARGRFPRLTDRDDLWKLLVVITSRKAADQVQHERRLKRGGGRVVGEAGLAGEVPDDDGDEGGLARAIGREPTPEFAAQVAEECRRLLDRLGDETLRRVALRRMEGYTDEEIAGLLGCTRRTIVRKLDRIRRIWLEEEV
jgi:DNA-directed RNA polymerase specialized sigma24 family protein